MKWHIAHSICLLLCSRMRRCCSLGQAAPPLTSFTAGRPARSSAKLWQSTSAGWRQRARGRRMEQHEGIAERSGDALQWSGFRLWRTDPSTGSRCYNSKNTCEALRRNKAHKASICNKISSSGCALAPQICTLHFCVYPATVYPQTTSCTQDHVTSAWVAQHLHGSE
jgi:hypothetical protein